MQENEFEKQVQDKMEDLKLHPSEAVWQKIELQIKKEKRRRLLIIFLPLLLIGALYGGYVLLNYDKSTALSPQQATQNLNEKNIQQTQKTKAIIDSTNKAIINQPIEENKENNAQTSNIKTSKNQKVKTKGILKITTDYDVTTNLSKNNTPAKTIGDTIATIAEAEILKTDTKSPEQELVLNNHKSDTAITNTEEILSQSKHDSLKDTIALMNQNTLIKQNVRANEINKTGKNNSPWNWGFSFSVGRSSMANRFFEYGNQSFDMALYDAISLGGSTSNPPSNIFAPPSLIKPSIAIVTGISAEKNISQKIIFTAQLNYKLYSTTNTVGADSAGYFRVNNANRIYHNYYNYIELHVGLKYQIADLNKIKLYWNMGVSISRLISSNALHYNIATKFYYQDNSLFNKTQAGLNTGLDLALLSKQKRTILIGPYFNYGLTKVARDGYNKHHFNFIGLRAQYLFRKNNF